MSEKEIAVCHECGSSDVLCDAFAEWDVDEQEWVLNSTYDKGAQCETCQGECRIDFIPLSEHVEEEQADE